MTLLLALLLQANFTDLYRQAYEERLRAGDSKAAESATDLALYLAHRGEYAQAAPFLDAVLASANPDPAELHQWAEGIESGSPEKAERLYRRALAIRERTLPAGSTEVAATRLNLAGLLIARGKGEEAETLAKSALAAWERAEGPAGLHVGLACGASGAARAIQGDVPGAERLFRRALAIAEKTAGPRSEQTAAALENLGDLLAQTGRRQAALPLLDRAKRIRAVHSDPVVRKPQ